MLLSSVSATQDELSQSGWSGELVFTEYVPVLTSGNEKTEDNSSSAKNTGSAAPAKTVAGTIFQQMCQRAGIVL
jgi:hypothetical protein